MKNHPLLSKSPRAGRRMSSGETREISLGLDMSECCSILYYFFKIPVQSAFIGRVIPFFPRENRFFFTRLREPSKPNCGWHGCELSTHGRYPTWSILQSRHSVNRDFARISSWQDVSPGPDSNRADRRRGSDHISRSPVFRGFPPVFP